MHLIDPVKEIASILPNISSSISYQHDGEQEFLLGVVDPIRMTSCFTAPIRILPRGYGSRPPNLALELHTLVNAIRDAEILATGNVPSALVNLRHDVW